MRKCVLKFVAVFAACTVMVSGTAHSGLKNERQEVQDPHYGEVLFYFYQQKYFSAITRLMASRQLHRVRHHDAESELLLGGLYLSYGLHLEAGRIFQRLIDASAPPAVRNRAWFYLAKIRYQRGYLPEAAEALSHIHGRLPDELQDERQILQSYLLMNAGQYDQAVRVLSQVRGRSGWGAYGNYNLGVALIKADRKRDGLKLLDDVGRMKARDEEMKALRDKANVALGFTYLQDKKPDKAKDYLQRVRLSGMLSNKALLGIGWSYSAQEKHRASLTPWMELYQRNAIDPAVQESLLAVPYAFGKVGALKQSLQQYEQAIAVYTREIDRLGSSMLAIRAGKMTDNILRQEPENEMGWFWRMQELPDAPESRYLVHLMAGHDFQEALKNYRDMRLLLQNLKSWSENIDVYNDMVDTRRLAYEERLPRALEGQRADNLEQLRQRRNRYAVELTRIEQEDDFVALATADDQRLMTRLQSVKQQLPRVSKSDGHTAASDKYRLLRGVLLWNIASDYKPRLWQMKKNLKELDQAIAETGNRSASLQQTLTTATSGFEGYDEHVASLRRRIEKLQARLYTAASDHERYLENLAIVELERQQQRLTTYLTQARFAVAQIYDQAGSRRQEAP